MIRKAFLGLCPFLQQGILIRISVTSFAVNIMGNCMSLCVCVYIYKLFNATSLNSSLLDRSFIYLYIFVFVMN